MPTRHEEEFVLEDGVSKALVADMGSNLAVIVTHPWGVLGGNMHNNVVVATALYFQRAGLTTVRFNFCGSQIGRGYIQRDQVQQVAAALLSGKFRMSSASSSSTTTTKPPSPPTLPRYILLVGYSYGSLIAGSASADIPQCIGVVSIAPPFGVQHWLLLFHHHYHLQQAAARPSLPRLLVMGSNDNFTSESVFLETVRDTFGNSVTASSNSSNSKSSQSSSKSSILLSLSSTTAAVIKGADHFFARREKDLMDVIAQWLATTYQLQDVRQLRKWEQEEPSSSSSVSSSLLLSAPATAITTRTDENHDSSK